MGLFSKKKDDNIPSDIYYSEDKSKSKKFIKIAGFTLLVLSIIGGSLLYYMDKNSIDIKDIDISKIDIGNLSKDITNHAATLIKSFGLMDDKPVTESNKSIKRDKKSKKNNKVITINLSISKKYSILYSDIALCTPDSEKNNSSFSSIIVEGYDKSYSCIDDKCSISIDTKSENIYPREIEIYEKDKNGTCTKRKVDVEAPIMSGYSALLEFTPQLLKRLGLSKDNYEITTQKSQDIDIEDINGIKKIKLNYDKILMADLLMINGEERVILRYKEVIIKEEIDPREELKSLQVQIERLKDEKKKLKKRLEDNI